MKKSPIKFKGAGINMPQDLMPGQPQQQVTGGMQSPITPAPVQPITPEQDYTPPAYADINFREKSEKLGLKGNAKDQYDQHQKYIESLPYFDVAANNDAIRNATTDQWGTKIYGAGHGSKQGRTRGMPPVHIPGSSTGTVTQQFTNYNDMGMGGVAPGAVNPAVGMQPTGGGWAERGAQPTTSAFAYKQKNNASPFSFTGAAQAALGQRQQSGMGIFNPTGNDIAGFENQQAANKMAMNTNTYNQQAIPGEAWKQHQPFTGSGFNTPLAQTGHDIKKMDIPEKPTLLDSNRVAHHFKHLQSTETPGGKYEGMYNDSRYDANKVTAQKIIKKWPSLGEYYSNMYSITPKSKSTIKNKN